jgi:exopolysaccharide biosynthesis polyprenyl glycosylphosphotransferase
MFRRFSIDFALFSLCMDAILVPINLIFASYLRPFFNHLSFISFIQDLPGIQTFPLYLYFIFPLAWVFCFFLCSVYNPSQNFKPEEGFISIFMGSSLALITLAGVLFFTFRDCSRIIFLTFFVLNFFSALFWRQIAQGISTTRQRRSETPHRVVIIGAGLVGKDLQQKIEAANNSRIKLVGFLDDDQEKQKMDPLVLGSLDNTRALVQEHRITDVILALPLRAHERSNRIVADLHDLPVRVYIIPDYFAFTLHHAGIDELAGIPMLDLRAPALTDYQRLIKRAFDIIVTLMLLPFVLPIMGIIAIAIRLNSPGSIFFHQDRIGENGRMIKMHKFRTMVENAEQLQPSIKREDAEGRPIHKVADDPRVTPLGYWLRRLSLDELPQFFNILKGEMSLVGPRPEMPSMVQQYAPWQRKRFAVPPGLTGWWQIHGRSDKPMHLHTEEDLYYIQNYSPWLDIIIMIKTIGAVISRRGAY